MEILKQLLTEGKAYFAKAAEAFNSIESPAVRGVVAVFAALVFLMVLWAVLPWIGFILLVLVVAFVAKSFIAPTDNKNP